MKRPPTLHADGKAMSTSFAETRWRTTGRRGGMDSSKLFPLPFSKEYRLLILLIWSCSQPHEHDSDFFASEKIVSWSFSEILK